ncbi:MAG: hypothetical protein HS117_08190 [Verrucomicrobiaceae bacterium]|nr:hypothetical protein [Verrucomicrobiaceae bacterium]
MKPNNLNSVIAPRTGTSMPVSMPELRAFTVVAFYDDLSDALRTKTVFERLKCTLTPFVFVNTFAWSFQQLESPEVRSQASHAMITAGMVVIASHARQLPYGGIDHWLESCLVEHSPGGPLLVVLDGGIGSSRNERELRSSMRDFAARKGTRFINDEEFDQEITPASALQWVRSQPASSFAVNPMSALRTARVPRHFGIND